MEILLWILLAMTFYILFKKFPFFNHQTKNVPPGPKPWWIIGNLNLIGPLPHQSIHKLTQKYGPLMQLKFGSKPVVVASSADMAKLFLRTYDHIFASRPATAVGKYTAYNYCDIAWAPYGPYWLQGRKIYLNELFSSKRLESYEYIRVEERRAFASRLYAVSGKPVCIKNHLSRLTLSILSRIVLGKNYFTESESGDEMFTLEEFQEMLDELFFLNGVLNIGDWIPCLDFLDLQGYVKRMKVLSKKFDKFHEHVFDEHRARRVKKDYVAKDMVDLLLELADDPNLQVKLTSDGVKGLTQDLMTGGADTTSTTVEWAMSELIKHPKLMAKATQELDKVIGREKWVEESDISNLSYLDAIVKETLRLHPVAVLLTPRLSLQDCNISGFNISKGTTVLINSWSIGRDEALWEEPHEFRPERFLGLKMDVKGQNFELLPFGSGRRMCPGFSLGLKMISLSLGNMLHGFKWKLTQDMKVEDLSMDEVYGLATPRKYPLVAIFEPRLFGSSLSNLDFICLS
ncbi:Flavonoid 3'-monooxygenase [Abeliophyllum distichum]|uniref:Flavonoid 3'-monooxygenase n=1 Tax=Abeliophyllum distichum TaxID=126358 RepID=A0ABD1VCT8_9LAMI